MSNDDISNIYKVTIGTPEVPRKTNGTPQVVVSSENRDKVDQLPPRAADSGSNNSLSSKNTPNVVTSGHSPISTGHLKMQEHHDRQKDATELHHRRYSGQRDSYGKRGSGPLLPVKETEIDLVYGMDTGVPHIRRHSVQSTSSSRGRRKSSVDLERHSLLGDERRSSLLPVEALTDNHNLGLRNDKHTLNTGDNDDTLLNPTKDVEASTEKQALSGSMDKEEDEDYEMSEEYLLQLEEEWSEDEEENIQTAPKIAQAVLSLRLCIRKVFSAAERLTRGYMVPVGLLLLYFVYFGFAMSHSFGDEGSVRLLAVTVIAIIIKLRHVILRLYKKLFRAAVGGDHLSKSATGKIRILRKVVRWFLYLALAALMIWTLVDVGLESPSNLRSLPGIFIFLLASLVLSDRPSAINWHTVYWAAGLQFIAAVLVLRWSFGSKAVLWTQARLDEFFANSKAGSILMFGESYEDHYVLFGALPIIFLTNATLVALYYVGAMQLVIQIIGNSLNFVLETSPLESMGVAAGIFMEGVTALLALKPFLKRMTKSQLFLVITSIFSSLGGAYLAILSTLGISLTYLIPAMVVSAPATFAVCKLIVPETKPNRKCDSNVAIGEDESGKYQNLMEAVQMGAIAMVPVVGDIIVSAYTFVSVISWINTTTVWFGDRVGIENLTIEVMASYLLYPVALFMGVAPEDCRVIGMLMGYRIFTANFVAFLKMTELKANRVIYDNYMLATNFTGEVERTRDDIILTGINKTLVNGFIINERSEAIITYSLCGFSSFLAVAITLGIMISLVPNRRKWIITITIPALVAGNVANCMTGCFAGIFYG